MERNPIVSVIIPNYNGEVFLKECLTSLEEQTYKDFETIVVDNGSGDESCRTIREGFPAVRIIELGENTGFSKAANKGIEEAAGEFIFMLNNDTSCEPDCIRELVSCIQTDPRIFSVNSKMIQYNNRTLLDDTGDGYCLLGLSYKKGYNRPVRRKTRSTEVFSACGGASLYRKNIMDEIGGFDENFFAYLEDVDLGYSARIHGCRNIYCPDAIVYHVMSGTSGIAKSEFKTRLSARNNSYLIYKNMPVLQLLINLPFLLIGVLIKTLFFMRQGLGMTYFRNSFTAAGDFPKLKKTRFRLRNTMNYIKIEGMLIVNCFGMIGERIIK